MVKTELVIEAAVTESGELPVLPMVTKRICRESLVTIPKSTVSGATTMVRVGGPLVPSPDMRSVTFGLLFEVLAIVRIPV